MSKFLLKKEVSFYATQERNTAKKSDNKQKYVDAESCKAVLLNCIAIYHNSSEWELKLADSIRLRVSNVMSERKEFQKAYYMNWLCAMRENYSNEWEKNHKKYAEMQEQKIDDMENFYSI